MLLALEIGHTIAIVERDETESLFAAGAITFMYTKSNGIVLYFQVHNEVRTTMKSQERLRNVFAYVMGMPIVHRSGKDHAAIYLMANEVFNSVYMSIYTKLRFKKFIDPNQEGRSAPKPVLTIKKCTSVFNTFFIQNDKDGMVWLSIEDTETFRNSSTWQMSLMNPDFDVDENTGKATICDNVFCQFPNGITYEEYDCIKEGLFAFEKDVFFKGYIGEIPKTLNNFADFNNTNDFTIYYFRFYNIA
jgi:hypothetical protein